MRDSPKQSFPVADDSWTKGLQPQIAWAKIAREGQSTKYCWKSAGTRLLVRSGWKKGGPTVPSLFHSVHLRRNQGVSEKWKTGHLGRKLVCGTQSFKKDPPFSGSTLGPGEVEAQDK